MEPGKKYFSAPVFSDDQYYQYRHYRQYDIADTVKNIDRIIEPGQPLVITGDHAVMRGQINRQNRKNSGYDYPFKGPGYLPFFYFKQKSRGQKRIPEQIEKIP